MSNNDAGGTLTPLQRIRQLEHDAVVLGRALTGAQADRDRMITENEQLRADLDRAVLWADDLEDDMGATREPLLAALHIFHDRHHAGPFRACWNEPCGSLDFDRDSTSPHAGDAPMSLPLAVVPLLEATA